MFLSFILYILIVSLGIWYAKTAGKMWNEAMYRGGWIKIVMYAAVIMSAVILTWCYIIVVFKLLLAIDIISSESMDAVQSIANLLTMPLVAMTSLLLYLDLFTVWQRRGMESGVIDEKLRNLHFDNVLHGGTKSLSALEQIDSFLDMKDKNIQAMVVGIVVFSLFLGIYTTIKVFMHYKEYGRKPLNSMADAT